LGRRKKGKEDVMEKATLSDLDSIVVFFNEVAAWLRMKNFCLHWGKKFSQDNLKKLLTENDLFVLKTDGQIVGTVGFFKQPPAWHSNPNLLPLFSLAINPVHHKQGFGLVIANFVINKVAETGKSGGTWIAATSNQPLINMYKKHAVASGSTLIDGVEFTIFEQLLSQ